MGYDCDHPQYMKDSRIPDQNHHLPTIYQLYQYLLQIKMGKGWLSDTCVIDVSLRKTGSCCLCLLSPQMFDGERPYVWWVGTLYIYIILYYILYILYYIIYYIIYFIILYIIYIYKLWSFIPWINHPKCVPYHCTIQVRMHANPWRTPSECMPQERICSAQHGRKWKPSQNCCRVGYTLWLFHIAMV